MKELYLAMDEDGAVWGYSTMPYLSGVTGEWMVFNKEGCAYRPDTLVDFGIDITKFPIKHETPIKIRAVWEVCP